MVELFGPEPLTIIFLIPNCASTITSTISIVLNMCSSVLEKLSLILKYIYTASVFAPV